MRPVIQPSSTLRPWYREPWPWLLMRLPASAVAAGLVTWLIALRSDDGLVAQDYYKKGLAINRVLASQERATQMGLSASLQQDGEQLDLVLESTRDLTLPDQIRLSLLNPARAGSDQVVILQRDGKHYKGKIRQVRDGRWNLKLEDEGGVWRLFTETRLPLLAPVRLEP